MDYNRPLERASGFGAGLVTGNALASGEMFNQIQANLEFRISSAREMLKGGDVAPIERRQMIRERRMQLMSIGQSERGSEASASTASTSTDSGRINGDGQEFSSSGSDTVESNVPLMTDAQRGTKKRADEHNFL